MAAQTPVFVQNENLHVLRGKGVDGVKADLLKHEKKAPRKDRKALADLSKTGKPLFSGASKGPTLKERSLLHGNETTKKALNTSILSDEETKRCHEWAREGVEQIHFTGNDLRKLEKDILEKCVKKKVDMVMSSLNKWTRVAYDHGRPMKKVTDNIEDAWEMKLEPEALLSTTNSLPNSDNEEMEYPFAVVDLHMSEIVDVAFELKLKEDYEDGVF